MIKPIGAPPRAAHVPRFVPILEVVKHMNEHPGLLDGVGWPAA